MKFISPMMRRFPRPKPRWAWITLSMLIPAAVLGVTLAGVFSETFRDWLLSDESGSTTIRNLGLVLAGLIALPLAIWRGLVAQRQADAAQQSLRNERYQKGAEMLGHERLSVRLGGIYALKRLAEEYPEEYHVQIMRLFSAFALHPTADEAHVEDVRIKFVIPRLREDVQAVIQAIGRRNRKNINLEREDGFDLDLTNTYLMLGDLREANLAHAILTRADLRRATLTGADLSGATLNKTKLSDAILSDTILSGAYLFKVIGLTQTQLDQARADPKNPPKLYGVLDAETGQPLVWTGGLGAPLENED